MQANSALESRHYRQRSQVFVYEGENPHSVSGGCPAVSGPSLG